VNRPMLHFIKTTLEETLTEEEKYSRFIEVAEKEISPEELAEVIKYIKEKQSIIIDLPNSLDICGTWGSSLTRINTSTLTAIQLAKKWMKVTKHGNNASSGRFGSFDLIETLWYKVWETSQEIIKEYNEKNIAFLHAKKLYPFFKEFSEIRKKYEKPTIFNIIWPLLCPANSDFQMIWCSFEDKMQLMIETSRILWRKNVIVLRWEDWLDEVTLTWKTKILELRDRKIKEYSISPENLGFEKCWIKEIMAEKIEDKIKIAKKIIAWVCETKHKNLVDINTKVALNFINN